VINRIRTRHRYRSMFYAAQAEKKILALWGGPKRQGNFLLIAFPKEISISGRFRGETLTVIERIKECILSGERKILLDFSMTKKIIASAMIAIYAELNNIKNVYPDVCFRCRKKTCNKIRQVLTQIGIYKMCGQKCFTKKPTRSDVVHWRVCMGVGVICEQIDKVISENEISRVSQVGDIYGGCIEATKNALRHAYPEQRMGIPVAHDVSGWWCFSQVKDNNLTVVVCDLGVSIPRTLPLNFPDVLAKLKSLGANTDADIIAGALKRPRSSSGESYRGNGLPKMMEVASVGGSLIIYSRRGTVNVFGSDIRAENYRNPLRGTIISWSLPLGGKE